MTKLRFILSSLWAFLLPVISVYMSPLGKVLLLAATEAVRRASGLPPQVSNVERQKVAYNNVVRAMQARGYYIEDPNNVLRESLVNTAIELALQDLKAKR